MLPVQFWTQMVLEGIAPERDPQTQAPMDVEEDSSAPVTEAFQAPPELATARPLQTTDASILTAWLADLWSR